MHQIVIGHVFGYVYYLNLLNHKSIMKTNSYFLFISVLSLVFGSLAFTSCNDDDDKDSKTSNLDGYWKITKSTRSNSSAETTFADDEGYITWYDESTNTETH